jgi:hypothetical protein
MGAPGKYFVIQDMLNRYEFFTYYIYCVHIHTDITNDCSSGK